MRNIDKAILYMLLASLCAYCAYGDYQDKSYLLAVIGFIIAFSLSVYSIGQLIIKGE